MMVTSPNPSQNMADEFEEFIRRLVNLVLNGANNNKTVETINHDAMNFAKDNVSISPNNFSSAPKPTPGKSQEKEGELDTEEDNILGNSMPTNPLPSAPPAPETALNNIPGASSGAMDNNVQIEGMAPGMAATRPGIMNNFGTLGKIGDKVNDKVEGAMSSPLLKTTNGGSCGMEMDQPEGFVSSIPSLGSSGGD